MHFRSAQACVLPFLFAVAIALDFKSGVRVRGYHERPTRISECIKHLATAEVSLVLAGILIGLVGFGLTACFQLPTVHPTERGPVLFLSAQHLKTEIQAGGAEDRSGEDHTARDLSAVVVAKRIRFFEPLGPENAAQRPKLIEQTSKMHDLCGYSHPHGTHHGLPRHSPARVSDERGAGGWGFGMGLGIGWHEEGLGFRI